MSERTAIEWCDSTFNPWIGCQALSPACTNCYAAAWAKRYGRDFAERTRTSVETWAQPRRWEAHAAEFQVQHGRRRRVFCASLADVFDNQVPADWREDLFELIRVTPHLDWLLLTKRPQNIVRMVRESGAMAGNGSRYLPENVWLGTTAEDQRRANHNIPALLHARPELGARVLFVSCEPMLGPVELDRWLGIHKRWRSEDSLPAAPWHPPYPRHRYERRALVAAGWEPSLQWVIAGGESGPGGRPMHPDWARSLRDQCEAARVPFLFKQWGEWRPICQGSSDWYEPLYRSNRVAKADEDQRVLDDIYGRQCRVQQLCLRNDGQHSQITAPGAWQAGTQPVHAFRLGKKAAGRMLDGLSHDDFPGGRA